MNHIKYGTDSFVGAVIRLTGDSSDVKHCHRAKQEGIKKTSLRFFPGLVFLANLLNEQAGKNAVAPLEN